MRLRRQHVDQSAELHSAADDLGDPVEHLGRVAARLALEAHDERELLCVVALHPARHHHERVVERDAELLVLEDAAELGLRRLDRAVDHDRERAHRRVTRPHRAGEDVEVVCELLLERPAHLPDRTRHDVARDERRQEADEEAHERLEDDRGDDRRDDPADDRPAGDREGREAEASELDVGLEALPPRCPPTVRCAVSASIAATSARRRRDSSSLGTVTYCAIRRRSERFRTSIAEKIAKPTRASTATITKIISHGEVIDLVDPALLERALRREVESGVVYFAVAGAWPATVDLDVRRHAGAGAASGT